MFTIPDICLVVMYHYIQGSSRKYGPCWTSYELFTDQIRYLKASYNIIDPQVYHNYLNGGTESLPDNSCVLTFDDGLREHYEVVFPVLKEFGIKGIFFINGFPLTEKSFLDVHKIHIARNILSDEVFIHKFEEILRDIDIDSFNYYNDHSDPKKLEHIYRYDSRQMQKVKYFITYKLDYSIFQILFDKLLEGVVGNLSSHWENYYMNSKEIKSLCDDGMTIGNHTWSHKMLLRLSVTDQKEEITKNHILLKDITGKDISAFSVPYGKTDSFNNDTTCNLVSLDYKASYITERGINVGKKDRFHILRIDTNELVRSKEM